MFPVGVADEHLEALAPVQRVSVRGCAGMGTTWFEHSAACLFNAPGSPAVEVYAEPDYTGPLRRPPNEFDGGDAKHSGCHLYSHIDPHVRDHLLDPGCDWRQGCVHAVITRHPTTHKTMRIGNTEPHREEVAAWEAYHGAWIDKAHTLPVGAVRFFRFEDVTTKGCTASLADATIALRYQKWAADHSFARMRAAGLVGNESVWHYWNYTEDSVDTHETLVVTAAGHSESNALHLSPAANVADAG